MRAAAWGVALLSAILAGCSGEPASSVPSGPPATGTASAIGLEPPKWAVGDWWSFSGPFGSFTYAVSGVAGEDYVLDTDDADLAFYDARFDVSTLGPVRKSDLAGSQGATRVAFFDWPLWDNKTWTMTLDEGQGGGELQVTADQTGAETYTMTARRANGTAYVSYTYDAQARWFTQIDFKEPDGSDSAFKLTLKRSGKSFDGSLVRWSLKQVVDKGGDLPPGELGFFSVEAGATDVYAELAFSCTTGKATVAIGVAAGPDAIQGYGLPGPVCPAQESFAGSLGQHTDGDNWGYLLESTGVSGAAPPGTYALKAWQRTLQSFSAGQAPP